jgi:antirestriction protein ArdC
MKTDIYETITAAIIEAIETGCDKFKMPWNTTAMFPMNAHTQRRYRGVNVLMLWAQASKFGYTAPLWATYQQWHQLGAQVKKGQKSTPVVFWKFYDAADEETDPTVELDDKRCCFARAYHVFNAAQVDGFTVPEIARLPEAERIDRAEALFQHTGLTIIEGGSRAFYDVKADEIHIPPFSAFAKPDLFYSLLGHEAVHSSGHPSRLNRALANRFGSEPYAAEELLAEIGSALLAAELNLDTEPRRAIFSAASKAQHAVQWLMEAQPQEAAGKRWISARYRACRQSTCYRTS